MLVGWFALNMLPTELASLFVCYLQLFITIITYEEKTMMYKTFRTWCDNLAGVSSLKGFLFIKQAQH